MNLKTINSKILASNTTNTLAGVMLCLLPLTVSAAPAKTAPVNKTAAATTYECTKCHMKVSAATAKKDHYKDSMDGGTLVPVKTAKK